MRGDYLSAMYKSYQQPQINYNMWGDYLSAMYKSYQQPQINYNMWGDLSAMYK